jgi:hypothetical protein
MTVLGLISMNLCPISPRRLTCGYLTRIRNILDMCDTLKKRSILNRKAESPTARLGRRRVWATFMLIAFISCFSKDYSVADKPRATHYKQYAFIKLNHSFTEFYCLDELYHHESRWNPSARNGSHYGIPQGRSKYLAKVDGFKQVDWGIKYNLNRYGSMCKALNHFKIKGWH